MKTQEGIDFINDLSIYIKSDYPEFEEYKEHFIELLRRGEKYSNRWTELTKIWFDYKADCYWIDEKAFPSIFQAIEYLQKKYFPKEKDNEN